MTSLGSGKLSTCLNISVSSVYCEGKSDTSTSLEKMDFWVKLGFGLSKVLWFEILKGHGFMGLLIPTLLSQVVHLWIILLT